MLRFPTRAGIALTLVCRAAAGIEDDTGYTRLAAALGPAMPTGAGVGVSQIESGTSYLPQAGSGTYPGTDDFTGCTFIARSGASALSLHAQRVAYHLFGPITQSAVGWNTMAPGITDIDCYSANGYIDNDFLQPGAANNAPVFETRAIQNHSWIAYADSTSASSFNGMLRRLDFAVQRDGFLCFAGVNNTAGNTTPDLMAAAYNVISVGLTNGDHSTGGTSTFVDGPGRLKPELVAPFDATSWATAYVSSAAAILRQRANATGNPNAVRSETLRAALLAGATKDEFPAWTKSAAVPLDATFGAGELEVFNSDAIIAGGEQTPDLLTSRPDSAWDHHTIAAGATADYRLVIPAGTVGRELSAFLVWNRTLTDPPGGGFNPTVDAAVDLNLSLDLLPAAGGATPVDQSTSTLYTMEHVWKRNLPAGTYRLRVTRPASPTGTRSFALAWRLETAPHTPQTTLTIAGGTASFAFSDLLPGQPYQLETSTDLVAWSVARSFTATAATDSWSTPATDPRRCFRLVPVSL